LLGQPPRKFPRAKRLKSALNLIYSIETMDLTIGRTVVSISVLQKAFSSRRASMTREYELFERFPDGSSLWRASVSGLGNVRQHLHELTRKSENQFYAIDLIAGKTLRVGYELSVVGFRTPRKTRSQSSEQQIA
jgi:hypothetical protein